MTWHPLAQNDHSFGVGTDRMSTSNPYDFGPVEDDDADALAAHREQEMIDALEDQRSTEQAERQQEEQTRPLTKEEEADRDAEIMREADAEPDWYGKY